MAVVHSLVAEPVGRNFSVVVDAVVVVEGRDFVEEM